MAIAVDLVEEIKVLTYFNVESIQEGIKVHGSAEPAAVKATQRLFDKGLISQNDGGYLTDLGVEAAQHVQSVLTILKA